MMINHGNSRFPMFTTLVQKLSIPSQKRLPLLLSSTPPSSRFKSTTNPRNDNTRGDFNKYTDRAKQLHKELEELMHHHNQRSRIESVGKPIHQILMNFISKYSRELANVSIAFFGTVLAYQVYGLRVYGRKLENELVEKETVLEHARSLLRGLTETKEFAQATAKAIELEIQNLQDLEGNKNQRSIFSMWSRPNHEDHSSTDFEIMVNTIHQALEQRIGEAGFSDEQKQLRQTSRLQAAQDELLREQQRQFDKTSVPMNVEMEVGNSMIQVVENSTGDQIMIKRSFHI